MPEKTPFRLAFVDMDDTLLGPDKSISPENLAALARLRSAGIQVVITSGRHHKNILSYKEIGRTAWTISSQGAVVRNEQTDEVLLESTLAPEIALTLARRGQAQGFSILVYNRDGVFTEEQTDWTRLYARKANWTPQLGRFEDLAQTGLEKVFWSTAPARIAEIAPGLIAEFENRLYVVATEPELLEFLNPGINKATGAEILARHLGIAREETLAFGDGNNDVELLHWAGLSVAMRHGRDSAKQAATLISPADATPATAFARSVDLALSESAIVH
ncbi:Cof-type HAD-IIB family hydrolase [soil metagenome]